MSRQNVVEAKSKGETIQAKLPATLPGRMSWVSSQARGPQGEIAAEELLSNYGLLKNVKLVNLQAIDKLKSGQADEKVKVGKKVSKNDRWTNKQAIEYLVVNPIAFAITEQLKSGGEFKSLLKQSDPQFFADPNQTKLSSVQFDVRSKTLKIAFKNLTQEKSDKEKEVVIPLRTVIGMKRKAVALEKMFSTDFGLLKQIDLNELTKLKSLSPKEVAQFNPVKTSIENRLIYGINQALHRNRGSGFRRHFTSSTGIGSGGEEIKLHDVEYDSKNKSFQIVFLEGGDQRNGKRINIKLDQIIAIKRSHGSSNSNSQQKSIKKSSSQPSVSQSNTTPRTDKSSQSITRETLRIMTVQRILQQQGLYEGKVDGIIGPLTTEAVKKFQEKNDLTVDGIVGPNTFAELESKREEDVSVVGLGSWNEKVKKLQEFLSENGHQSLSADGKFGPMTFAALKKWQNDNGLVDDGIAGPRTWAKIKDASS